jgi:Sulfotransferase family
VTPPAHRRPILVTGAHRSGTTWVGTMLALAPRVGLIHEPFSPRTDPGIAPVRFDRFFRYVCAENENGYVEGFERILHFRYAYRAQLRALRRPADVARSARDVAQFTRARLQRARPLLKDPIAVFSAEWLEQRFGCQVVVLARHPAAFASSLKRLGWGYDWRLMLDQPLLLRDHLARFEPEIRTFAEREHDLIDQAILLWRVIYSTVAVYRDRHPDWLFERHEDLSLDPVGGFERLYGALDLTLDQSLKDEIRRHSAAENPQEQTHKHSVTLDSRANVASWRRRLSADEITRIREGVADVSGAFYSDEDW